MTMRLAGAALAAVMACAGAGGAQAYVATGYITQADLYFGSGKVGDRIRVDFSFNGSSPYGAPYGVAGSFTDIDTGAVGQGDGTYYNGGDINADGGHFLFSNLGTGFGQDGGRDGAWGVSFTANGNPIPADPDRSFGPIRITGQGMFSTNEYIYDDNEEFIAYKFATLTFSLETLSNIGSLPAVPLPPSSALFGLAIMTVGVAGYRFRRGKAN